MEKQYHPTVTTEHGTYGAFLYPSYRLAQIAIIELRKALMKVGIKIISEQINRVAA